MTCDGSIQFIPPEQLAQTLKKKGRGIMVTHDSIEVSAPCSVSDENWNHMDKDHRPWIHRTYQDAVYLATGREFQVSLTSVKVLGLSLSIQVTDVRLKEDLFYQCYSLFNLINVATVVRSLPGKVIVEQYISSHFLLKPLHFYLKKRLYRLNEIQNAEDAPIRERRAELRRKGYMFDEAPDFISANQKSNHVQFPKLGKIHAISIRSIPVGTASTVSAGPVDLLVRPNQDGTFSIWTGACPHEGGPLEGKNICPSGTEILCRWHGLRIQCLTLGGNTKTGSLGPFKLSIKTDAGELLIEDLE
jgi:nitrite reductase/ring-hydroxylating ferredoxin subunit